MTTSIREPVLERLTSAVRRLSDELKRSGVSAWIAYDNIADSLARAGTLAHAAEIASGLGRNGRVRNFSSDFQAHHVELYNAAYDAWQDLVALARQRAEEHRYEIVEQEWSYARCCVHDIRRDAVLVVCPYLSFQALLCSRGARRVVDASSMSTFLLRLASERDLPAVLSGLIDMGFSFLRDERGAASPAGIVAVLWTKGFTEPFMELVRHPDGTSTATYRLPAPAPAPGDDAN